MTEQALIEGENEESKKDDPVFVELDEKEEAKISKAYIPQSKIQVMEYLNAGKGYLDVGKGVKNLTSGVKNVSSALYKMMPGLSSNKAQKSLEVIKTTDEVSGFIKTDPVLLALYRDEKAFDPTEYFTQGDPTHAKQSLWLTVEIQYMARHDSVKGTLTLKNDHMQFVA